MIMTGGTISVEQIKERKKQIMIEQKKLKKEVRKALRIRN